MVVEDFLRADDDEDGDVEDGSAADDDDGGGGGGGGGGRGGCVSTDRERRLRNLRCGVLPLLTVVVVGKVGNCVLSGRVMTG